MYTAQRDERTRAKYMPVISNHCIEKTGNTNQDTDYLDQVHAL